MRHNILEQIIRWGLFVIGVVALMGLFTFGGVSDYPDLRLNSIAPRKIIAPFDFEILKLEEKLEKERKEARAAVPPVFVPADKAVVSRSLTQLDSILYDLKDALFPSIEKSSSAKTYQSACEALDKKFGLNRRLLKWAQSEKSPLSSEQWDRFVRAIKEGLKEIHSLGVLNRNFNRLETVSEVFLLNEKGLEVTKNFSQVLDLDEAKILLLKHIKEALPGNIRYIQLADILSAFIEPTILLDESATEYYRAQAAAKIAIAEGFVLKDERIIDANERVTQEVLDKLNSLKAKKVELSYETKGAISRLVILGRIIFSAGILFMFGFLVIKYRPDLANNRNFALILLILLAPLFFLQLVLHFTPNAKILFPSALTAMLITIFYGYRVGFWFVISISLLAAAMQGGDFQLCVLSLITGAVGIVSVKQIKSRTHLMTSSLFLAIAYILTIVVFASMQYSFGRDFASSLGLALVTSIMTPIFVLGFAVILGNLFDITTDLTLLELSDLNRPLLKQLSSRAPGTYHHSLMVGALAESAAEAVDANSLLARVGAYYHDLGKMEHRDYFIENQYLFNPHDTISPEESARILNSHLSKGVEIAEENHLPKVVKDIIAQHHGANLMQYFYHKASKLSGSKAEKGKFRYPGPLPETKESGIIMLADMVEAAVRSMENASPPEIESKVKEIIDQNYLNGQLEHCQLALSDLHIIAQSFVSSLKAQAHHRIKYPSWKELEHIEANAKED